MYEEAQTWCIDGTPSIFSIISLLENEAEIKSYLQECKEMFLDKDEPLFPKTAKSDIFDNGKSHYDSCNKRQEKSSLTVEELAKLDDEICKDFMSKQNSNKYRKMKETRRNLPSWAKMNKILEMIDQNQVTIISGETGCGKSTQVSILLSIEL